MTNFTRRRFSVPAPGTDQYRDNYERTFGKKEPAAKLPGGHRLGGGELARIMEAAVRGPAVSCGLCGAALGREHGVGCLFQVDGQFVDGQEGQGLARVREAMDKGLVEVVDARDEGTAQLRFKHHTFDVPLVELPRVIAELTRLLARDDTDTQVDDVKGALEVLDHAVALACEIAKRIVEPAATEHGLGADADRLHILADVLTQLEITHQQVIRLKVG